MDKNNPYERISPSRIEEQVKFYNHTSKDLLLSKMISDITVSAYSKFLPSFHEKNTELLKNELVGKYLNSVLQWLLWSPVGLQLSMENAQLIFTTAAFWLMEQTDLYFNGRPSSLIEPNYLEQLSSFYASSILPTFWLSVLTQNSNKEFYSFANKVYLILTGELKQEVLLQYQSS
jgi:hypothetical protein